MGGKLVNLCMQASLPHDITGTFVQIIKRLTSELRCSVGRSREDWISAPIQYLGGCLYVCWPQLV